MSELHSYSKVAALGHPQLEGLTDAPVSISEKIDGSQFGFMLTADEMKFRSRGALIYGVEAAGMFKPCVEAVLTLESKLTPNYLYRAEFISKHKHNALKYDRVPAHYLVVFDIEDMNIGPYNFLPPAEVRAECACVGLEYIEAYSAQVSSVADLTAEMQKPSMLGGEREGVVLKRYDLFTRDGKVMMGKYVSEKYKETHAASWKVGNPGKNDIITNLITGLRTDARYAKAAQHLRERGELTETVRDIGPLIREVQTDVIAEEADQIRDALYRWAKPQVERGVAGGVVGWYKALLAAQQFEARDPDSQSIDTPPDSEAQAGLDVSASIEHTRTGRCNTDEGLCVEMGEED